MEEELGFVTVEDAVHYQLFLVHESEDPEHHQDILQQYIEKILAHFASILVSYIWQNESFNLKYKPAKGKTIISNSVFMHCNIIFSLKYFAVDVLENEKGKWYSHCASGNVLHSLFSQETTWLLLFMFQIEIA